MEEQEEDGRKWRWDCCYWGTRVEFVSWRLERRRFLASVGWFGLCHDHMAQFGHRNSQFPLILRIVCYRDLTWLVLHRSDDVPVFEKDKATRRNYYSPNSFHDYSFIQFVDGRPCGRVFLLLHHSLLERFPIQYVAPSPWLWFGIKWCACSYLSIRFIK